ncbi:MAG: CpsD/CapB family tyrosine-protein kinase [Peptostreptococcaceae bacterium]
MKLFTYNNPKSHIAEAYRILRTNIEFSNVDEDIKTILVTSAQQNEGKSTVVANLAATFASLENKKVLVMDGDLRNPTAHKMFDVSNLSGLTDVLTGQKEVEKCIEKTKVKNLDILKVGKIPPNPSEMLQSKKMQNFMEVLKQHYDYIFIDSPPVGIVTDASILSQYADGTILLVGSKETEIEAAKMAKERLEKVNAKILGAILNKFEPNENSYGYYNYYYGSSKKETKRGLFKKK